MKIRSVTQFIPLSWPFDEGWITSAARLLTDARHRLGDAGFEVQTVGLATPPFLDVLGYPDAPLLMEYARRLDGLTQKHHLDFASIGPVTATTPLSLLMPIHTLPQVITQTERVTAGVLFADAQSGVNLAAARALANAILEVANSTPNGAGNLRLGALANVPAHTPYPTAAYQQGSTSCFAAATEAADLVVSAVNNAHNLRTAQKGLVESVESCARQILKIMDDLVDDHQVEFKGIDFSLAPFPNQSRSIGAAIERLGVEAVGGHGTSFVLFALNQALQSVNMPRVGFSSIMLSLLGDVVIARRNAQETLNLSDLLLYAALGSTGPDLVPIPGDTPADEIAAIFLDMGALALATGHPLSARLLPIPGAMAGDPVDLGRPYLTGSTVMAVKNSGVHKLFEQNSFLMQTSYRRGKKP